MHKVKDWEKLAFPKHVPMEDFLLILIVLSKTFKHSVIFYCCFARPLKYKNRKDIVPFFAILLSHPQKYAWQCQNIILIIKNKISWGIETNNSPFFSNCGRKISFKISLKTWRRFPTSCKYTITSNIHMLHIVLQTKLPHGIGC